MSNGKLILEDQSEYLIDEESLQVSGLDGGRLYVRGKPKPDAPFDTELPNFDVSFSLAGEETATMDTLPTVENATIIIRTDKEEHVIKNARICGGDGNKKIEITGFSQK